MTGVPGGTGRRRSDRLVGAVIALGILAGPACHSLDVANPNELENERVFSDPLLVEAVTVGALRTWFNAYTRLEAATLSTQARTLSASWNNASMNFYSGVDNANGIGLAPFDTTTPPDTWTRKSRSWQNDDASDPVRPSTTPRVFWHGELDASTRKAFRPGFHASLSSANDVLTAIRKNGVVLGDAKTTKRAETVAVLIQGASLMMIALNYDKGYIIDDSTDLKTLAYVDRRRMRDAAVAKLQQAANLAAANQFVTPASWTNNGPQFTNAQISQIANTMAAMTLAWYPRHADENALTDWARVATLASAGLSSGQPVNLEFIGDGFNNAWNNELLIWASSLGFMRVSTRVAHFIDPATQKDPWPLNVQNPRPNSPDKRLGDGSFGDASIVAGFGTVPRTANGGSDFAWSSRTAFPPVRGYYHQSNIGFVRYDQTGVQGATGVSNGYGRMPVITATVNDLLWAEALLRQGGSNAAQAAGLINRTRVNRGGLAPASGGDPLGSDADGPCMSNGILAKNGTGCTLFSKLLYEYEIELLGLGAAPFYNQRHLPVLIGGGAFDAPNGMKRRYIQGLLPGTPREMPVPLVELMLKNEASYTWGGLGPSHSPPP